MKWSVFLLPLLGALLLGCLSTEEELSGAPWSLKQDPAVREAIQEEAGNNQDELRGLLTEEALLPDSADNEKRAKYIKKSDKNPAPKQIKKVITKPKKPKQIKKVITKPKKPKHILSTKIKDIIVKTFKEAKTNIKMQIGNLKKWGTFGKDNNFETYTVTDKAQKLESILKALTYIRHVKTDDIMLTLPLPRNTCKVKLSRGFPTTKNQVYVQTFDTDQNTKSYTKYYDLVAPLKGKMSDSKVAGILLKMLESDLNTDSWNGFSAQQRRSAVEFLMITQVAEAMVPDDLMINAILNNEDLEKFTPKSGRVPGMDMLSRYFLELIRNEERSNGELLTFKNVFGNKDNSLYIMAGTGGTNLGRNFMEELIQANKGNKGPRGMPEKAK
ncbi:hypothetical protein AOXY_G30742 [Acipenser oxyrinchus oxyrinchus]|uniref:Lipoprotein n=1 Tax=Acipenser oxyrinchus oxyrinchus TaxID=40147 RepID=A0AAD8FR74_ACIOX|nr:hypothetical protein AOXY_G30742 [Acipenser oxyrinchus oxyrinchus]